MSGPWWWDALIAAFCPGGDSLSVSTAVEKTGYDVEAERMSNAIRLRQACDFAVSNPDWMMHDITADGVPETFCNRGLAYIAGEMGETMLKSDQYANTQIRLISDNWLEEVEEERVTAHALAGGLAVACLPSHPHGHVAVVYPSEMEWSGTWGRKVPVIANVGKRNGVMKLSGAFRKESAPHIRFYLRGTV